MSLQRAVVEYAAHSRDAARQALSTAAPLSKAYLPTRAPPQARELDRIVKLLRLGPALDSAVGGNTTRGISGGELKRLNIATELLAHPKLLVLDEPLSGTTYYYCLPLLALLLLLLTTYYFQSVGLTTTHYYLLLLLTTTRSITTTTHYLLHLRPRLHPRRHRHRRARRDCTHAGHDGAHVGAPAVGVDVAPV